MSASIDIDERMNKFRLASRELFNHYFRIPDPYNSNDGWKSKERFSDVQAILFRKLVTESASLSDTKYGDTQPNLLVELRDNGIAPIMLNREVDSGYWDFSVKEVNKEARMLFVTFFDWDQLNYQDNRYVRVQIDRWEGHPETVGKHALIESQYVRFVRA